MHITAQGPRLRNDLYCVEWDVKLYYTIPSGSWLTQSERLTSNCSIREYCAKDELLSLQLVQNNVSKAFLGISVPDADSTLQLDFFTMK